MGNQDIYIIGSGAIGKALAVFLKRKKKSVQLVRGSVDHVPNQESLLTVVGKNDTFTERITTTAFSNLSVVNGIVLVTTKTFANAQIAQKLSAVKGDFSIVLLQNGLNIERPFKNFNNVYRCVLFSTSQLMSNNEVRFKSVTASPIGNLEGKNEVLDDLIGQISSPQFEFRKEPNMIRYVWTKTIANCVFNTICPLLETDNGIFHRSKEAKNLAKEIVEECVSVAALKEVFLDKNEIMENLLLISKKSDGQLISTYVDILNKRPTEIESLNLEVAKIATDMGQPELVKNTGLLGHLILTKSMETKAKQQGSNDKS